MQESEHRERLLTPHFCIFLDVLGFGNLIATVEETGSHNVFERLHDAYTTGIARMREARDCRGTPDFQWEIRTFSDNILLAFPIQTEDGESELGFLIEDVSRFQLHLATRGYFSRGGMSIGRLFLDETMIFGPALIDAYELEKSMARDPRIVLSAECARLVEAQTSYYDPPHNSPQNEEFLRDADGEIFVNYLSAALIETDAHGIQLNMEVIESHRREVERGLRQNVGKPQIWSKFRWLAAYHNWFLDSAC